VLNALLIRVVVGICGFKGGVLPSGVSTGEGDDSSLSDGLVVDGGLTAESGVSAGEDVPLLPPPPQAIRLIDSDKASKVVLNLK